MERNRLKRQRPPKKLVGKYTNLQKISLKSFGYSKKLAKTDSKVLDLADYQLIIGRYRAKSTTFTLLLAKFLYI